MRLLEGGQYDEQSHDSQVAASSVCVALELVHTSVSMFIISPYTNCGTGIWD
jgi:hypothetical protein